MAKNVVNTLSYYRDQAKAHGLSPTVTMPDRYVVEAEVDAIIRFLTNLSNRDDFFNILEIGCGNGHLASIIHATFGDRFRYTGVDLTPEMIELARMRGLPYEFKEGSILKLDVQARSVDIVISDRVIINVLDGDGQFEVFRELARVTRPNARLILIEGFKSGLANLNRARAEFLMEPIPEPEVNNWFTEERWSKFLSAGFTELNGKDIEGLAPRNFLSSHYFMTRFVHDALRPEGGAVRNTEFARFFSQALPPVGDYAPLRIAYLARASAARD
jgi:ubiquinone/menaquinone biosynthesis C-methylase UbiE